MQIYIFLHFILGILFLLSSCVSHPNSAEMVEALPPIYPDYIGVTVPCNIAPLNFLVTGECEESYAIAAFETEEIKAKCKGNEVAFPVEKWHQLLEKAKGREIEIEVFAKTKTGWLQYQPFSIAVSEDSIDSYLTYRLIEPDYEVFSRLQIKERCIEDFSERTLCDYNMVGDRCMNCHTFGSNRPDLSFFYVRGEGGGMIMNRNGCLKKLNLRTDDMTAGSVYGQFSPSGRFLAFSTNVIIPGFHSEAAKRLEVFDTKSDIYVVDLDKDEILRSPLLSDSLCLETFPAFSPDGNSLYFCTAQGPALPASLDSLQYHLCRIDFDESTGRLGERVDTVLHAKRGKKTSVCHPRVSPDGKFLLYTVADYGTFPIWHRESDQRLLNLETGEINELENVNSDLSDTYHSWASNGRWFVFASKRDDGLYGKPYFCHVDENGCASKPFVLPQKSPAFYGTFLKSFNVPELGAGKACFSASDVPALLSEDAVTMP